MRILGTDVPLLLWGAERPFQIQLLAAMVRLGTNVTALCAPEGKVLVDQIYPKNYSELKIPNEFEGALIWAPETELFSNSELSPRTLTELHSLVEIVKTNSKINECFLLLPQAAYSQIEIPPSKFRAIYFPTVVGFGDKNIFDKLLDQVLKTGILGKGPEGELLSLFDAISLAVSYFKSEKAPSQVWASGQHISPDSLTTGFHEIEIVGSALRPLHFVLLKLLRQEARFEIQNTKTPENVALAMDLFPTVLTSWERFFRDSYRIYVTTPESTLLLHFRPTKTP